MTTAAGLITFPSAESGKVSLVSTIVADNTTPTGTPDIYNNQGTVTASNSLIENGTITENLGNNITGRDPLLDPKGLQDNGGSTRTIALLPNSPAINTGSNPRGLTTDQRRRTQIFDSRTDIGAYERIPPWTVQEVNVSGNLITTLTEAEQVITAAHGTGSLTVNGQTYTVQKVDTYTTEIINFGAGGNVNNNQTFPDDNTDVILGAAVNVTIPPGTYTIALGSDDGGLLRFQNGVTFFNTANENGHTDVGTNEIRSNAPRSFET